MSHQWSYVMKELVTGSTIDHVQLEDVEITFALNAAATMQAKFPMRHDKAKSTVFDVGRVAVWALDAGIPRFGGILWNVGFDTKADKINLEFSDFFSWFFTRHLQSSVDYVNQTIQTTLVGSGTGATRGLMYRGLNDTAHKPQGIVLANEQNGTTFLTAAKYDGFELTNIGRAIEDLSKGDSAFDFIMEPSGTLEAGFTNTFKFWSPSKLRRTGLRWRIEQPVNPGSNLLSINGASDATEIANKVWVLGEGEGTSMLVAQASDATALSAEYPMYETVLSYKNVKAQSELDKIAQRQVKNLSRPVNTYVALLKPDHVSTQLGAWTLGDTVLLTANWGYLQVDNKEVRIIEYTISILDESGDDRVTVELADFVI